MTKIFMNFAGMDDLKRQMGNLVDQLHELEREIARVNGRLDWEVSQKHDIDEQIDRARRKAAKLAVTSEQMTAVVATASTEFMRTDAKFSEKAKEQTNTLENIWRGFLGFATRTFDQIEGEGMQLLNSLRSASDIFIGRITDVLSVHPDLIRDMLGCCAVGVTPLAPFVVDDGLRKRLKAANESKTRESTHMSNFEALLNGLNQANPKKIWNTVSNNVVHTWKEPNTKWALKQTGIAVLTNTGMAGPIRAEKVISGALIQSWGSIGVSLYQNDWGTTGARFISPSTADTYQKLLEEMLKKFK